MDIRVLQGKQEFTVEEFQLDPTIKNWNVRYLVAVDARPGGGTSETMTLPSTRYEQALEVARTVLFFADQHRLISDVWIVAET